jgi:release factor glutamine methyltransferase
MRAGRARLPDSESPARDARDLMLWVAGIDAAQLIVGEHDPMTAAEMARYDAAIDRRAAHEPVSKIIGRRAFYGLDFRVTADVLDPRPDSETLIDAVLQHVDPAAPLRILDMGTGSGCLLLTLLHNLPNSTGIGVDISAEALKVAQDNAKRLHLDEKARFVRSDWLEKVDGAFDLVVCNPPYIGEDEVPTLSDDVLLWDPELALFADEDGLAAYRAIASTLRRALSETGTAFFEIGLGQEKAVERLFSEAGFENMTFRRDIAGISRCMIVPSARS